VTALLVALAVVAVFLLLLIVVALRRLVSVLDTLNSNYARVESERLRRAVSSHT
jgi:uncharacterized protein YoxC